MGKFTHLHLAAILCAAIFLTAGCSHRTPMEWVATPVASTGGFNLPFAALPDRDGTVYVSNIEGSPDSGYWEVDAAAFISKLEAGGRLLELRWINSNPAIFLNAPKGMCILEGWLYTADINRLVRYQIADPNQGQEILIAQGHKLVGVATDGRYIYVSDGNDARIYRVDPRTFEITAIAAPVGVAGIVYHGGAIYAASASMRHPEVYKVDPDGKVPPIPQGLGNYLQQPCSLAFLPDETLIVADFKTGKVLSVSPDRLRVNELATVEMPGILGFDDKRSFLYVPQLSNNTVHVLQLSSRPATEASTGEAAAMPAPSMQPATPAPSPAPTPAPGSAMPAPTPMPAPSMAPSPSAAPAPAVSVPPPPSAPAGYAQPSSSSESRLEFRPAPETQPSLPSPPVTVRPLPSFQTVPPSDETYRQSGR